MQVRGPYKVRVVDMTTLENHVRYRMDIVLDDEVKKYYFKTRKGAIAFMEIKAREFGFAGVEALFSEEYVQ